MVLLLQLLVASYDLRDRPRRTRAAAGRTRKFRSFMRGLAFTPNCEALFGTGAWRLESASDRDKTQERYKSAIRALGGLRLAWRVGANLQL